jgi:hypothetical protein
MQLRTLYNCVIRYIAYKNNGFHPTTPLRRFSFSLFDSEPHSELNAPLIVLFNDKNRVRW